MKCKNCNAEISDKFVKFCPKCGAKLQSAPNELRLQRALVPDLEEDKNNPEKALLNIKIDGNNIGFNYAQAMYISVRKPLENIRLKWKKDLINHIKTNIENGKDRSFRDFTFNTKPYFSQGMREFENEIIAYTENMIKTWPNFVKDNYREVINKDITSVMSKSSGKLQYEEYFEYVEAIKGSGWEHTPHSKEFQSIGGFGVLGAVGGVLAAEAANYAIDAVGAVGQYIGKVGENIKAMQARNSRVPSLELSMIFSCDQAANRIINAYALQIMNLCKLPTIDSTKGCETDEFKQEVPTSQKNYTAEKDLISKACTLLKKYPYDLSILEWIYKNEPNLDDDILSYGDFLNIRDLVVDMIEKEESRKNRECPFNKQYSYYNRNY